MNAEIVLVIMLIALMPAGFWLWRRAEQHNNTLDEELAGIGRAALDQTLRQRANKRKVLAILEEHGELTSYDISQKLQITDRLAVRYMNELEKEGQVEKEIVQERGIVYRPKQTNQIVQPHQ